MYDTNAEAKQKLASTIVLLEDTPVTVLDAKGDGDKLSLKYVRLRTGEEKWASIRDKGWEFRNLGSRLGYTNTDLSNYKEALYLTRMPVRKSIQGLSTYNVSIPNFKGSDKLGLPKTRCDWSVACSRQTWFLDTLEGKYPGIPELISEFTKNPLLTSRAFNRKLAIRKTKVGPFYLEYRGKDIGYTEDFDRWNISKDFEHLRESLEDVVKLKVVIK